MPADEFDLDLCVASGQVFRWDRRGDGIRVGVDGDRWYRVETDVKDGDARRDALAYVAEPRQAAPATTYRVETNGTESDFRRLFRLDWDTAAIRAEILRRGPEVAPYLGTLEGLRLMRPSDPLETFFSFLCTPNNNLPRIKGMVGALAEYGAPLQGTDLRRFPEAEAIAAISEAALREKRFGYRAATIPGAAAELVRRGGRAYLEGLKGATYEEAHAELVTFRGIGPKLADCIALFALHHTSAVPIDTHLWQAATRLYFPQWEGAAITDVRYRAVSVHIRERFGDLAGWAQQHFFFDSVLNWRSRKV